MFFCGLFVTFECNNLFFITNAQTERETDKKTKTRMSDGRDIVISLWRFTFISPGDLAAKSRQHEGGKESSGRSFEF